MELTTCQRKIEFHTHTTNSIQLDLIYAHQKHHAPTI